MRTSGGLSIPLETKKNRDLSLPAFLLINFKDVIVERGCIRESVLRNLSTYTHIYILLEYMFARKSAFVM